MSSPTSVIPSIFDGLNYHEIINLNISDIPILPKYRNDIKAELEIMENKGGQLPMTNKTEIMKAIDIFRAIFFGIDPEEEFLKLYEPYEAHYTKQGIIDLVSLACGQPKASLRLQVLYEYAGDCDSQDANKYYVRSLFWGVIARTLGFDWPIVKDCMGRVLSKMGY